jgi:hypothetical protein
MHTIASMLAAAGTTPIFQLAFIELKAAHSAFHNTTTQK